MADRRVVITGVGVVSPLGVGFEAFASGMLAGRHGIRPITLFDATQTGIGVAAEASEYRDELLPSDPRHHVVLSRPMQLGLVAAAECVATSGLDAQPDVRARTACLMALNRWDINLADFGESFARSISPSTDLPLGFAFSRKHYLSRGYRAAHPLWLLKFIPNLAVAHVVRTFGLQGEANTYTAEAASSLQLVGHAAQSIRDGLYDVALCGGADSRVSAIGAARYLPLGVLARGGPDEVAISMPFDRDRRGAVLGEGSAFFVVESLEHARDRGARPLAEVVGWGDASDAYHPYRAEPEGRGLHRSMTAALECAGASPSDVDLVVATAASMLDLDAAEAAALGRVFGAHEPLVTAPAGAIGRTFVAVGAFGLATAIAGLDAQAAPPTANTRTPATDAPAGLVLGGRREAKIRTVLVNAWSFGGPCASLAIAEVRP